MLTLHFSTPPYQKTYFAFFLKTRQGWRKRCLNGYMTRYLTVMDDAVVMNLRHIEIFQAIVQAGSISGAARLLNVSQPNVSRILKHAEQQLGFELFERVNRGMVVTREGERLIPEVQVLYQQLQHIDALSEQILRGKNQEVHLGSAHALGAIVAPAVIRFRNQFSHINVSLMTGHFETLCSDVQDHQLDLALVFGQQIPADLVAEPICQCEMVAILPPDHPNDGPVSLEWLCQNHFLLMHPRDPLGRTVHRILNARKLLPSASGYIKTNSVIADMVAAGGGTGIVDSFTALRYRDKLKVVPVIEPLPFDVMLISRRDNAQSKALLQLKKELKEICAQAQAFFSFQ